MTGETLDAKVAKVEGRVDAIEHRQDRLEDAVKDIPAIQTQLRSNSIRIDKLETMVTPLSVAVGEIRATLVSIGKSLDALGNNFVEYCKEQKESVVESKEMSMKAILVYVAIISLLVNFAGLLVSNHLRNVSIEGQMHQLEQKINDAK